MWPHGSIVCEDDLVYDVDQKTVMRLEQCIGKRRVRFDEGASCLAPVFQCIIEDPKYDEYPDNSECVGYAYDMILLDGEDCHYINYRVGPVAKLLGRLLRLYRGNNRRRLVRSLPVAARCA